MADHHETHDTHAHDPHAHHAPQQPLQDNVVLGAGVLLITLVTLAFILGVVNLRRPLDETARADNAAAVVAQPTTEGTETTEGEGTETTGGDTSAPASPNFLETAGEMAFVDGEFSPALAYEISCAGCHGSDGKGLPEIANSSLEGSELMNPDNRDALFAFLTELRPMPADVNEFYHPVRGEYPGYSDEQLEALIDYVYTLE